jgi:hypothetical protein
MKAALYVDSPHTQTTCLEFLSQACKITSSCRDSQTGIIVNTRYICLFLGTLALLAICLFEGHLRPYIWIGPNKISNLLLVDVVASPADGQTGSLVCLFGKAPILIDIRAYTDG